MSKNQATTRGGAGLAACLQGLARKSMTVVKIPNERSVGNPRRLCGAPSGVCMMKTGTRGTLLEPAELEERMTQASETQVVANGISTTRWLQDGLTVRGGVENPLAEGDPVAEEDAPRNGEAETTGTGGQALATAATAATEDGEIGVVRGIGGIAPQGATIVMTAGGPATAKRLAE